MEILETKKMPKNATNFKCYLCDFSCMKKSNYDNHLLTSKHLRKQHGNKKCQENAASFMCICSKTYTTNSGLWKHKKKCDFQKSINISTNEHIITNNKNDDFKVDKEFVMSILKQNNDLQSQVLETQTQVMELLKNGTHNTTNNNKTFNLNFFLNETCKNARLLQDFKTQHPDCIKSESKYSDTYNKLMIEAMGGKGCDDIEQESKIIKRLAKETTIDNI